MQFICEIHMYIFLERISDELMNFVNAANRNDLSRDEASILNYYFNTISENFEQSVPLLDENYRCQYCHKSFKYKTSLIQHFCEGGSPKRFRCNECGKLLARKSSLIGHLRIHTGEKPFQCKHCGKAFTHKHHLHSHLHTHKEF